MLYFEGQPSKTIKTKYNAKKFKRALEAIPRLGEVELTFSPDANGTVCQVRRARSALFFSPDTPPIAPEP